MMVMIYRILWSALRLDAATKVGLVDVITLEDHKSALADVQATVESLQRERDHAKKMEAVQKEVADNQTWHVRELRAALDAERENVAFVEQTAADFQALWRTACDQREVFETQLSQLQALVRAAEDYIAAMPLRLHKDHSVDWKEGYNHALYDVGQVLAGKRTLDASGGGKE